MDEDFIPLPPSDDRVTIYRYAEEVLRDLDKHVTNQNMNIKIRLVINYQQGFMWKRDQEIAELKSKMIEQNKELSRLKRNK